MKKFKKIVILDTIIFYPEHRKVLGSLAEEIVEYPSSLPESLEKQIRDQPELFHNLRCYTELGTNNIPLQLLLQRVEGADVIISCWTNIPDEVLELNPELRLIVFWTHEKEHRINTALAHEKGVRVENVPDYGTEAVAELVFAGLFEVIARNFPTLTRNQRQGLDVIRTLFQRYRMYQKNEKNTREGKFTHHFHKLGEVRFDFQSKSLDELIPEKLIAGRSVGLLNVHCDELEFALQTMGVRYEKYSFAQTHDASYYKFLSHNEQIIFDPLLLPLGEVRKLNILFPQKLINLQKVSSFQYLVKEKIMGIIGLGRIGTKVAKTARAFGFSVQYYSMTRKPHLEKELGIEYAGLPELIRYSDVVSLHTPAYHADNLINRELVLALKPGAIVINTADGNAIDMPALAQRMLKNEIFGFLDVYPGLPRKDVFGLNGDHLSDWKLKNVLPNHVLTYRAGWKTQESVRLKTYKLLGLLTDHLIQTSL